MKKLVSIILIIALSAALLGGCGTAPVSVWTHRRRAVFHTHPNNAAGCETDR